MHLKKASRQRRIRRARSRIRAQGVHRLLVHRTSKHMYAQIVTPEGERVLASASTVEKAWQGPTGNVDAASKVGAAIAERAQAAGVSTVAFDRAGFLYHGRVKALAEAARSAGLHF
ncbi:MAG: 50S ribosomal protein L18 [Pseudomonadota bacterium]|nr:50S ribosomal protein L18 [Pseudomonadota bacterium]